MAGHSKWSNIKHRKGAQDAKRGKIFTKLIREITIAAKLGGEDPASNPRLRAAIDKALAGNMTRDTINRAVKRGAGTGEADDLMELSYEGYGPGGTAILVHCLSDNRNRTVADVRHAFTKAGGNLGTDGSVAYLFNKGGLILYAPGNDEDSIMNIALENDAQDIITQDDGSIEVHTTPDGFDATVQALKDANLPPDQAEITYIASTSAQCDADTQEKLDRLLDALEDLDDVQNVYHNGE